MVFKLDYCQIGEQAALSDTPFEWVTQKSSHREHMGLECGDRMMGDIHRLEGACAELGIVLPAEFRTFMMTPEFWCKFRSVNGGFFDLRESPVKSPVGGGYLIPFISDQQYCHFHFLHVFSGSKNYDVLWADDLYKGAVYASQEVFEEDYKDEFDKDDIYLCDNSFEHFLWCHYQSNEKWFVQHGY